MAQAVSRIPSRTREGLRVGLVTIVVNLALSAVKIAAGVWGRSYAVVADGIESLTDIGTTAGFLAALKLGDRPPDADHPYGHRRLESEITRVLTMVLMAAGVGIAWFSVQALRTPKTPDAVAIVGAALSIVVKEWMYHYTVRAGQRLESPALVANAWHHRSDALSSVGTLVAVIGAIFGWRLLDPLAGLAVGAFVVWVAARLYWRATRELVDTAPPVAFMRRMRSIVQQTPGVQKVPQLRARYHGSQVLADVTIAVDPAISVTRGHAIAETVAGALREQLPQVVDVTVHVDPGENGRRRLSGEK